jgi:hypothetical protein
VGSIRVSVVETANRPGSAKIVGTASCGVYLPMLFDGKE